MANGIERGGRLMIKGKISNLGTSGSLGAWVRGESMNPSCTYMARTGCGRADGCGHMDSDATLHNFE
jgi:hypothetical protein